MSYATQSNGERLQHVAISDGPLIPLGYQQITATTVAVGLTPPAGARSAVIDIEAQNVRWRDDGVAPTTTVGMRWLSDNEYVYPASDLTRIQFINEVAGAIVNVSYYG